MTGGILRIMALFTGDDYRLGEAPSKEGRMIPEIGVMVGLYIVTRMIQLVTDKAAARTTKVFGAITALVAALVMADLLVRGATTAKSSRASCPGRGGGRRAESGSATLRSLEVRSLAEKPASRAERIGGRRDARREYALADR